MEFQGEWSLTGAFAVGFNNTQPSSEHPIECDPVMIVPQEDLFYMPTSLQVRVGDPLGFVLLYRVNRVLSQS